MKQAASHPRLVFGRAGRDLRWAVLSLIPFFAGDLVAQELRVGGGYVEQGPGELRDAQTEGLTNNPVVGAVEAAAAHPTTNALWIGSVNGGIWHTTDASVASPVWVNQTPSLGSLSISAIAIDPTDPTSNTLVAGLDRTSSFGNNGGSRLGMLRTTDGGATWAVVGNLVDKGIAGLAPRGTTIVAAVSIASPFTFSNIGIFRSTDSGATFTQVAGGFPAGSAIDLTSDPVNAGATTSQLFAVTKFAGASSGIYRSTDTGASWIKVSDAAMDAILSAADFTRGEVAVGRKSPGVPTGSNVAVALCRSGRLSGLFYSGNAGGSWTSLTLPTTNDSTAIGLHPGAQCNTHLSITMDPTNHNVFYVGGDRQPYATETTMGGTFFPNSVGAVNFTGRLYRIDGVANTFTSLTHCLTGAPSGCGGTQSTTLNSAPHADSREMVFLANGHLIETDDGGVYRRTNPSGVGDWFSAIGSLPIAEQHGSTYDTVSNVVFSGNQDTGSGEQATSGGSIWTSINQGDGGDTAVGVNDPVAGQSTRYSSAQNLGGFVRRVFNAANVLQSSTNPARTATPPCTPQFVTPIAVNTQVPSRILLGCGNGLYESSDRGDTLTQRSTDAVTASGTGPAIAYGVTGNADALYYASGMQVFTRTAAPPTAPVGSTPGGGTILAVAMDSANAANGFALSQTQVSMTTTAGAPWSNITGNLLTLAPGTVFRSMAFIKGTSGVDGIAVGTNNGVYLARSDSGFATWQPLGTGLPNVPVYDLQYDPADDVLVAGTLGRGAWMVSGLQGTLPVELIWYQVD